MQEKNEDSGICEAAEQLRTAVQILFEHAERWHLLALTLAKDQRSGARARMARDSIKPSENPNGSLTYRVADRQGHIAAVTVGKNGDGNYWAVIEFRRGAGPRARRWDCPHWPQLLADINRKRMEYHCALFDIEEPSAAHW